MSKADLQVCAVLAFLEAVFEVEERVWTQAQLRVLLQRVRDRFLEGT